MRSLCKPVSPMPTEFGELILADNSAPGLLADKVITEVKTESLPQGKNSKGAKIGDDKNWNREYGIDQTKLGMPNAIDKETVNMEVNLTVTNPSPLTMRVWGGPREL